MKKYLLILIFSLLALPCFGQIRTSVNIGGYWGEWSSQYFYEAFGHEHSFIVYHKNSHPSRYFFKVVITNYDFPDAKEKREHLKSGTWYTYNGYVEYSPQWDDQKREYTLNKFIDSFDSGGCYNGKGLNKVNAIIKIEPYKKTPQTYNIFFGGYGVGINLNWPKK